MKYHYDGYVRDCHFIHTLDNDLEISIVADVRFVWIENNYTYVIEYIELYKKDRDTKVRIPRDFIEDLLDCELKQVEDFIIDRHMNEILNDIYFGENHPPPKA